MATDNTNNGQLQIGSDDYTEILRHAVAVIEHARTEIAKHVNGYVSTAYWEIGQMLHERKIESGYGDSMVKRLSADLKERYPKMGVSPRQLWNMKKFYERYAGHDEKVLRSVALLPWSHNLLLLSKGFNDETTLYYAQETITKGWNRDLLLNAIKLNMYETQALARVDNNFERTLPAQQAQYANEVFSSTRHALCRPAKGRLCLRNWASRCCPAPRTPACHSVRRETQWTWCRFFPALPPPAMQS